MFYAAKQFLWSYISGAWNNVHWMMMEMDVAQWGLLSAIFVAAGFVALRTRI